jgi:hypothetical protein
MLLLLVGKDFNGNSTGRLAKEKGNAQACSDGQSNKPYEAVDSIATNAAPNTK